MKKIYLKYKIKCFRAKITIKTCLELMLSSDFVTPHHMMSSFNFYFFSPFCFAASSSSKELITRVLGVRGDGKRVGWGRWRERRFPPINFLVKEVTNQLNKLI